MAILMSMNWPGVSAAQYEEVKRITNFENEWPAGGMFHVAAVDAAGLHVVDVWESPEKFQAFVDSKLMPCVQQLGITAEPQITILPAINVFNITALQAKK